MQKLLEKFGLDKIDDFSFQRKLTGGQASTTLIYENEQSNQIVIKMLIVPRNETELKAFKNEASALAKFAEYEGMSYCPKIIGELEQNEDLQIYFYRMEYIEGQTLKEHLENNEALSWEFALNIIQRVSTALGTGTQWYVHRDLHPGNILVCGDTQFDDLDCTFKDPGVRILDYGCSKNAFEAMFGNWKEDRFRHIGGVSTWSPEFIHNPETVNSTHDSWAIGTILYQLITNRYPFESSCFGELIEKYKTPIDLSDLDNKIPYAALCLLKNLLSIEPTTRFLTGEIADMCSDILYRGLDEKDDNFIDTYMDYRGNLFHCATCGTLVGRRHPRCLGCGRTTDEENTVPVLRKKDKHQWLKFPF